MTANIDLFAAAPSLMKDWQRTSTALASTASFDRNLTAVVKRRGWTEGLGVAIKPARKAAA